MKALWFFPLTFVAGVHGFALFAPYVAVVLAALMVSKGRRRRPALAPVAAGFAAIPRPLLGV